MEITKRPSKQRPTAWVLAICLLAFLASFFYLTRNRPQVEKSPVAPRNDFPSKLSQSSLDGVVGLVTAVTQKSHEPALPLVKNDLLTEVSQPVYVGLRKSGRLVNSHWADSGTWAENLVKALRLSFTWKLKKHKFDTVEICLTYDYQDAEIDRDLEFKRGIMGLEMSLGPVQERLSPTDLLARNRSFKRARDNFLRDQNRDPEATLPSDLKIRTFKAYQILVTLAPQIEATEMLRGNTDEPDLVAAEDVASLTEELAKWMVRQVEKDGEMPYHVFPGYNDTSNQGNLMVRQFLATWALGRWARLHPTKENKEAYLKNYQYNLKAYFKSDGPYGYFPEPSGQIGLGGQALAALAILEDPSSLPKSDFVLSCLDGAIERMWNRSDGSFSSYAVPAKPDYDQNFYPGEALLYWSKLLENKMDEELLAKFMKSFAYYREFHRKERRPAFIPWHTQAYYKVWKLTKNSELKDFIFEMNDWLLDMVLWEKAELRDFRGQFWNPEHLEYGIGPHVSSTAVYLEGLSVAYLLARDVEDKKRQDAYRDAILKGLRSLILHQFRDQVDLYYVQNQKLVKGALRTTPFNNVIRCDNGGHALLALLRIMESFDESDYQFSK